MKKIILYLVFIFLAIFTVQAQTDYNTFNKKSVDVNKTGMYVLGGWALANIATGGIGWSRTHGATMRFHQMNFFWNTVNLSIAGIALYSFWNSAGAAMSPEEILQRHRKTENLYLINAGLDVLYIGAGIYLRHLSTQKPNRKDLFQGYGNSVILQGAFLLVFDAVMWGFQRSNRVDFMNNVQLSFEPGLQIMQLSIILPL